MAGSTSSVSSSTSTSVSPAQSIASATSALFQASGLASGLNTSSIVDALINADSYQLTALQQKQSDYQVQISTIGTLVSQLQALQSAATNLGKNGVVAIQPTQTYADFTASGSALAEGNYSIQVNGLAAAAKMRSASFSSAQDPSVVPSGTLQFSIDGTNTATIDTTGMTLADVAQAVNNDIPGLTASVISTNSGYYLNVARTATGYATTQAAALTVVSDPGLGLSLQQSAQNASLTVDNLAVSRQSNTISDVIPGITLNLTGNSGVTNNVTFAANSSGTQAALNTFVTAYNNLEKTLSSQLVTDPTQQYGQSLLDYSTTSDIESSMQSLLSQVVVPSGSVQTLSDLGLELQKDGTLQLNTDTLANAIQTSPNAVNAVFSTATTGISDSIQSLVSRETDPISGTLTLQQGSLQSNIADLTSQQSNVQAYLDSERQRLTAEFTNMETLIAGYNSATTYLGQLSNQKSSGG